MEIKLTKEQYENLLRLVYLGNWMINAIRSGTEDDPYDRKRKSRFWRDRVISRFSPTFSI